MRGRISKGQPTGVGSGLPYRPEIDGLRAIAVSAVVLYHAGLGGAGFVGVDIFFVISGYLITSLLLRERESGGRIDLGSFYARRARRILPAAVLVVFTVCLASATLLASTQASAVQDSAAASLVFLANLHFQSVTGGYFDAAASEMPLMHLWSLSVEEQYYLLWPLALNMLAKHGRTGVVVGASVLALCSFVLAQYWLATDPELAFFQMPSRFWELATGAVVAASGKSLARGRWMPASGLILLGSSLLVPMPQFPGIGAMPAVIGTALILIHLHRGGSSRLLASKPMVGVGLISYSLYLWHWPLLALQTATTFGKPSVGSKALLCGVAVLLAVATYRYVESPIRRMRGKSWPTVLASSLLLCAGAASAWYVARLPVANDPFPLATRAESDWPDRRCHSMGTEPIVAKCLPTADTRWVIWGDSMAYAWMPAVRKLDRNAAAFSRDACGPFLGYLPPDPFKADLACRDYVDHALRWIPRGVNVVLVALWEPKEDRFLALDRTLAQLAPIAGRVVVLGPTPRMRRPVAQCIREARIEECGPTRSEFNEYAGPMLARLRKAAAPYPNANVVSLVDVFCGPSDCPPVKDGVPLYWDTHHVSQTKAQSIDLATLLVANPR